MATKEARENLNYIYTLIMFICSFSYFKNVNKTKQLDQFFNHVVLLGGPEISSTSIGTIDGWSKQITHLVGFVVSKVVITLFSSKGPTIGNDCALRDRSSHVR
jgi:hypothetical protein